MSWTDWKCEEEEPDWDVGQTVSTIKPVNCDPGHLLATRGHISFRPSSTLAGTGLINDLWENFKSEVWGFHHHFYADALIIGRKQFAWIPWQLRLPRATGGQEAWEYFKINERPAGAGRQHIIFLCFSLEASDRANVEVTWRSFTPEDVWSV